MRLAVFGQPISRSLSPEIHTRFAAQAGLDIDYRAIEATPESFGRLVGELDRAGGRGCNVTVPFKGDAWRLATVCSDRANRAEAANTLVFTKSDWYADNTDGGGLVNDLRAAGNCNLEDARICLLGAGGAARGVVAALLGEQPRSLLIANRTANRAVVLAERHADLGPVRGGGLDGLDDHGPFDLVINATSLGHGGGTPALPDTLLAAGGLFYDMNYGQAAKPLRELCKDRGMAYRDGLGMLVGQAALSFELWTGFTPNPTPVLQHLKYLGSE
jgi:shikimate dehydrogenase